MSEIVVYNNGEIEIAISINEETIWLTQKQIGELFDKDVRTINDHIKAIYKEKELMENTTIRKFRIVQKEGNREIAREVLHYNLDAIISVGYRVNSLKATKFRQWATSVLKSYITNGYAINSEKITNERFVTLENEVRLLKTHKDITDNKIEKILNGLESKDLKPSQGIFFDGQIYDAYAFVSELIKSAKSSITLFDNYIDDTVLTMLSKNQNVQITLFSKTISKQLSLDVQKYNAQYKPIELKKFDLSHDRFLLIDDTVYHIGASLKDLGKKWFAFSKMEKESFEIMGRVK